MLCSNILWFSKNIFLMWKLSPCRMIDISSTWCFLLCPIGFLGIGGCSIANPVPMDFSREEEDVEFEAANLTTESNHWQIVSERRQHQENWNCTKRRNGGIRRSGVDGCFRQQIGHQMLTNIERNQFWKWQSDEKTHILNG